MRELDGLPSRYPLESCQGAAFHQLHRLREFRRMNSGIPAICEICGLVRMLEFLTGRQKQTGSAEHAYQLLQLGRQQWGVGGKTRIHGVAQNRLANRVK